MTINMSHLEGAAASLNNDSSFGENNIFMTEEHPRKKVKVLYCLENTRLPAVCNCISLRLNDEPK